MSYKYLSSFIAPVSVPWNTSILTAHHILSVDVSTVQGRNQIQSFVHSRSSRTTPLMKTVLKQLKFLKRKKKKKMS